MSQDKLKNKVASLPDASGVYIFKDRAGAIIYIGKAKSLKKRVQSYFSRYLSAKTQAMVAKIFDIEYKITSSESQAQILEASLIKDNQPQYNTSLKDDKSFPWIKITHEEFPVISIARRKIQKEEDRSLYFGPYTNVKLLRQAFKILRRIFGFRSCKTLPDRACLYYRLNLCPAPCVKRVSAAGYGEIISQIKLFLESRYEELINRLRQNMKAVAEGADFEEAAKIRDQINALSSFAQAPSASAKSLESEDLRKLLKLSKVPQRIEAFDISNISGQLACGSMVSFHKGSPDKHNYRRFRIKTVEGIDDYKMLAEVIRRRYIRLKEENLPLPDLILIDGGRSHLSVVDKELKRIRIKIPLASIAKERENLYTRNSKDPVKLNTDTPALNLIRRIRDEAHRFALAYHHLLRKKQILGK